MWEWAVNNQAVLTWFGRGVSALATAGLAIFKWFFKDLTAMRTHRTPIEREFPERQHIGCPDRRRSGPYPA